MLTRIALSPTRTGYGLEGNYAVWARRVGWSVWSSQFDSPVQSHPLAS